MKRVMRWSGLVSALAVMGMGSPARAGQPADAGVSGKPEKALYIQGSEVNLRTGPSKTAEVAAKVVIGTECRELAGKPAEKGWVKLKCGESEGYTLKSLVGSEAPDFDKLLEQANDESKGPQARYDAAMRAGCLKPRDPVAGKALQEAFYRLQFHTLKLPNYKLAWHDIFIGETPGMREGDELPEDWKTEFGLDQAGYDSQDMRVQKMRFVHVLVRLGKLHVVRGKVVWSGGRLLLEPVTYDEWDVNEALAEALSLGARKNPGGYRGEGPLWPVDGALVKWIGELPRQWYGLKGEPGKRENACASSVEGIQVDLESRAISFDSTYNLISVKRSGSVLHVLHRRAPRPPLFVENAPVELTFEWPTPEPFIALWNRKPFAAYMPEARFPASCPR